MSYYEMRLTTIAVGIALAIPAVGYAETCNLAITFNTKSNNPVKVLSVEDYDSLIDLNQILAPNDVSKRITSLHCDHELLVLFEYEGKNYMIKLLAEPVPSDVKTTDNIDYVALLSFQ